MNVQSQLHMDKPAFLAWAEGREGRFELVKGRIVMMTGGSRAHALIIGNVYAALRSRLDLKQWSIFADFGVDGGPDTLRYPDILVEAAGGDPKGCTTPAPIFIAEILSPSSVATDLGDKAAEYLRLPSLAAYLVHSQDEPKAWLWVRGVTGFPPGPQVIEGKDAAIRIAALGVDLPLADIYAGVVTD